MQPETSDRICYSESFQNIDRQEALKKLDLEQFLYDLIDIGERDGVSVYWSGPYVSVDIRRRERGVFLGVLY